MIRVVTGGFGMDQPGSQPQLCLLVTMMWLFIRHRLLLLYTVITIHVVISRLKLVHSFGQVILLSIRIFISRSQIARAMLQQLRATVLLATGLRTTIFLSTWKA